MKRRDVLKLGCLGSAGLLLNGLFENVLATLYAAPLPKGPKNYLLVNLFMAPARWPMDQILKPAPYSSFYPNPFIKNRFVKIGDKPFDFQLDYATTNIKGILFPHLWKFRIPAPGGKTRAMKDLSQNALFIRGCNMILDGHYINNRRLDAPHPGGESISGLVADHSGRPFSSVSLTGTIPFMNSAAGAFRSPKGKSPVIMGKEVGDYLKFLADPFENKTPQKAEIKKASQNLLAGLMSELGKNHHYAPVTESNRKKAEAMLEVGLEKISNEFSERFLKYRDLIDRSIRQTKIKGVTDKKVPGLKLPLTLPKKVKKNGLPYKIEDYLGTYRERDDYLLDDDIRDIFKEAEIYELAQQFAISEIIFEEQLSHSIVMTVGGLANLKVKRTTDGDNIVMTEKGDQVTFTFKDPKKIKKDILTDHDPDSHEAGTISTMLSCSLAWNALASCLLEYIHRLKANNLFDDTLIHVTTEFEREPAETDSGTHHGVTGHSSTLINGKIFGPQVIGNIYDISHDPNDVTPSCGTWGKAAPVEELNNHEIVYGNIASTICHILGVPSPIPNERSLVKIHPKTKVINPILNKGKNVPFKKSYFKKSKRS